MTLLARAAGVPARMVTGYRVAERNPWGAYYIVRERHAHAWSEVYLPERGWVTLDPSPLAGTQADLADRTSLISGLVDFAQVLWDRHGAGFVLVVLVVVLAAVQLWRLVRGRMGDEVALRAGLAEPPDHVGKLLTSLSQAGFLRPADESLEAFARRLTSPRAEGGPAPLDLMAAGELIRRYAAFRYGEIGDEMELQRDVEVWLGEGLLLGPGKSD